MRARFLGLLFPALVAAPASGDPIGKIAPGAYCRDARGAVRQPHVTPPLQAEADRVAGGMVKTEDAVGDGDCYFYFKEVALSEAIDCPSAAVAKPGDKIAGTLGAKDCNDH